MNDNYKLMINLFIKLNFLIFKKIINKLDSDQLI